MYLTICVVHGLVDNGIIVKAFVISGIFNMSLTNLRTARLCRPEKPGSVVHKIDSLAQSQYPLFVYKLFICYLFVSKLYCIML